MIKFAIVTPVRFVFLQPGCDHWPAFLRGLDEFPTIRNLSSVVHFVSPSARQERHQFRTRLLPARLFRQQLGSRDYLWTRVPRLEWLQLWSCGSTKGRARGHLARHSALDNHVCAIASISDKLRQLRSVSPSAAMVILIRLYLRRSHI
jgi:hypothetical protein